MAYPFATGYAQTSDVQFLFKQIASFSSLDATEINRRLTDTLVEIDSTLAPYYVVPVAGDAAATNLLQVIHARLAAAEEYRVYLSGGGSEIPIAETWRHFAELLLTDIITGNIQFFFAPKNAEHPRFPRGHGAQINSVHDMDLFPQQRPIFQRIGRGTPGSLGGVM